MPIATADLCDTYPDMRVCEPVLRDFGGVAVFHGPVLTVTTFEDNGLFRDLFARPGEGRVLVVDGGGSLRCALFGGNLATQAAQNGWAGIVVNGCVRDVAELAAAELGVRALATCPRRPGRAGVGALNVPVGFAGVLFRPGDHLYADRDGIVVADRDLLAGG